MNHINNVLIIGLGLIGGSIAKAIKRAKKGINIIGCDIDASVINKACFDGAIDMGFCCTEAKDYVSSTTGTLDEIKKADVIFLCTNINTCKEIAKEISPYISGETIITDVCSTKADLFKLFDSLGGKINYIGGHPMAGSEKSGFNASHSHLFENSIYILCPHSNVPQHMFKQFEMLIKAIGAIPYIQDPVEHDIAMARISHFPHVMASALVKTAQLKETEEGSLRVLAAGGFKDITRIASSDPKLWKHIISTNPANVCEAIDDCIDILKTFRDNLKNGNLDAIEKFFTEAREYRDSFQSGSGALMNLMYELSVDVEDKPGVIADITTRLRNEGINIKNIYIAESREHEGGCLRLVFDNKDARDRASKIIK